MSILEVRDIIQQMTRLMGEKDFTSILDLMHDDITIIRPSGNHLNKDEWFGTLMSDDIEIKHNKLVSIGKIEISNSIDMAYIHYTVHSVINYKGIDNNSMSTCVSILKKQDGLWKITYLQRSCTTKPKLN
tara:strand:+ start:981 stop:1370 length:390 start_codon:yes stop_codon:yes gene_type:complete